MYAKTILKYWELYKQYIQENNLDDDSGGIKVSELVEFVEQNILPNLEEE